ncbi:MAG: NADH:flavin oxidoreductase [Chloroflexota bacterium]
MRNHYKIFSPGKIGRLTLSNRLVRSATWDPSILKDRQMKPEVLELYRRLALGGAGMLITGDFSTLPENIFEVSAAEHGPVSYENVRIENFAQLAQTVHHANPDCKIIAQISIDYQGSWVAPSEISSPYTTQRPRPLSLEEIQTIVGYCAEAIVHLEQEGFDGVQLHAAHGGLLGSFLSPYSNRRTDAYGGAVENRTRLIREIVSAARDRSPDFPILIKMNCTDYIEGGVDAQDFPGLARAVQDAGVDAIEISGGRWDCLVRSEQELGFRPVPAAESHTRIKSPEKQSYFLKYAELLALDIPVILCGGNRDVERLEQIVVQGKVDFVSMCRPLISEPDLPRRWLEGRGGSGVDCISCNSCIYDMWTHVQSSEPWIATCLVKQNKAGVKAAQRWLSTWVKENTLNKEV